MDSRIDMEKAVEHLRGKRSIFVSEADLQLELAWILKDLYPDAFVRCEYVPRFDAGMHIDILVIRGGQWTPIELKYKTKGCEKTVGGEYYRLKNHGAKDVCCYLYLKDIQRIERIREHMEERFAAGYTLFVTNELSYMKKPRKETCVYRNFSLENGAAKTGTLNWSETVGAGTKENCEEPIRLKGCYDCEWKEYSRLDDTGTGTFIYLLNEIKCYGGN